MDWTRLCRALDAEHIEQLEDKLSAKLAGRIKDLSREEWEQVAEHERWLDETD